MPTKPYFSFQNHPANGSFRFATIAGSRSDPFAARSSVRLAIPFLRAFSIISVAGRSPSDNSVIRKPLASSSLPGRASSSLASASSSNSFAVPSIWTIHLTRVAMMSGRSINLDGTMSNPNAPPDGPLLFFARTKMRGLAASSDLFSATAQTMRGRAPKARDPVTRSTGSLPEVPFVKWEIPMTAQLAASAKSTTG